MQQNFPTIFYQLASILQTSAKSLPLFTTTYGRYFLINAPNIIRLLLTGPVTLYTLALLHTTQSVLYSDTPSINDATLIADAVMHQQSNTVTFGHLADVTTDAYNTKVVDLKKLPVYYRP